jgi:recombinational DNA repair protein (RecF pathway)
MDPGLYDLLCGGLRLLELCPLTGLAQVLHGLELRLLQELGLLPALDRCSHCGELANPDPLFDDQDRPGLSTRLSRRAGRAARPTG